jgi:outer membrane protein assembly factor BamA
MDGPDGGSRVPFYLQPTLGGSETLRGFREYRFRDRNLFYLSGEYRWEPVRAVELALFYDTGKVFADRSDFDFERLRKSVGIGLRFKTTRSVVFRIDAARSDEGSRIYFKFGPAFD